MSDCLEVLFISDTSEKQQTVHCVNPNVGTTLMTYKGNSATSNCVSIIGNDYIIAADIHKPILNFWPLNSQEPLHSLRTVIAGKPSAISVSPDGHYCVAGIDGKIYVWLISSGTLLNVISRHYQAINKIVFMDNSSHFITAGEDSHVLVWKLAEVVARQCGDIFKVNMSQVNPVYDFSHHSLPVKDVFIGPGNLKARLYTVSSDQTCKIYCLSSGQLLLSVVFEYILTSLTVNDLETELFVGTSCGKIQNFHLDSFPRVLEYHVSQDINTLGTFNGHTKAVGCLCTSLDGVTLASGSDDEKVFLWNIPCKQLIRSFDMKGPVTNLFFHIASSNIFSNKLKPQLVVSKFEKAGNLEDKALIANVWVHTPLKPISLQIEFGTDRKITKYKSETTKKGGAKIHEESNNIDDMNFNTVDGDRNGGHTVNSVVSENHEASLRQQISTLKNINKQLYEFAMSKIIKNPTSMGLNNVNNQCEANEMEEMEL